MRMQLLAFLTLPFLLTVAGCDVDVEEQGEMPSVDVDAEPGQMPEYDVVKEQEGEMPEVDMQAESGNLPEVDVQGPDVDVDRETVEVPVPDVDVDMPDDESQQTQGGTSGG